MTDLIYVVTYIDEDGDNEVESVHGSEIGAKKRKGKMINEGSDACDITVSIMKLQ